MTINNNRKDHCLRAAVDSVQALVKTGLIENEIYQRVLENAAKLTESPHGFVLSIRFDDQQPPVLSFRAGVACTEQHNKPNYELFYRADKEEKEASAYWLHFINRGLAAICEDADNPDIRSIFPDNTPNYRSALFIPLIVKSRMDAVICVFASPRGYTHQDITRLRPLWAAYELVMRKPANLAVVNMENNHCPQRFDTEETVSSFYAKQFFSICYASFSGIISVDENFCITSFNSAAESVFLLKSHEAIGRSLNHFIPDGASLAKAELTSVHGARVWHEVDGLRQGNLSFKLDLSAYLSRFGNRDQITFIVEDISDRIESARLFQENSQRFAAITNLAPVGIIQIDNHWSCIYANEKMSELSGLSPDELANQGWLNAIHEADTERVISKLKSSIASGQSFAEKFCLQTPLGQVTWVNTNARALYDELGNIIGTLATVSDITAQMKVESQLRELAEYDPLTGLVNRTFFNSHLQQAFDSSTRHGNVVLFFLDLDGFKQINDSLGHDVGDELLIQVAQRIQKTVRTEDVVARLGGDEFTVILTHLRDDLIAMNIAEKIIGKMQAPFLVDNQEIFVTVSIGIATGNAASSDRNSLLKQADIALYRAKELGRNNFQFFTPEMDAQARVKMFLSNSLHRALKNDQFELFYQPQLGLTTTDNAELKVVGHDLEIVGIEALLRWRHPDKGIMGPQQFMQILEETSLINEVSEWALSQASRQMKQWLDNGVLSRSVKMSVNISARQMYDQQLPDKVAKILTASGLPPHNLILEITESSLMDNSESCRSILLSLKSLGIKISLDDFGTGYSSLSYLKKFPIDQLKIDRSFVADIIDDSDDASIVSAIIAMAKNLKLEIVAEGVDAIEKLDFLRELDCDVYQGYYFSQPLSATEIESHYFSQKNRSNLIKTV